MSRLEIFERCNAYLAGRRRTYEDRIPRFRAAFGTLWNQLGMRDGDTLIDLGAGHCEFDLYLRQAVNWRGRYLPVDGALDGTDLQDWKPTVQPDLYVLMEVLEHLPHPFRLLQRLEPRKGILITTPNPEVVNVIAIDEDHRTEIHPNELITRGFQVERQSFFNRPGDTILAWKCFSQVGN